MSAPDRRAIVERPGVDLSVRRRCTLLKLARSGVYRLKPVIGAGDLALMRRIDERHLELPFYGSRRGYARFAETTQTRGPHTHSTASMKQLDSRRIRAGPI
jgi:hypothetical protein